MTQDHHPSEHGGLHMRPLTEQDIPQMQELFRKETRICQSCGTVIKTFA